MTLLATIVFFFVEYVPEDGRKRLKHVGGLPHVCISLYIITVQILVCTYIYIYIYIYIYTYGGGFDILLVRTEFRKKKFQTNT
jgi:hypothetical protein